MQKIIFLFAAIAFTASAKAQMTYPIEWEANPKLHTIPDSFKKESAVFVLDQRRLEYKAGTDKNYYVYRTTHRIIRLMDDKGVEAFNKFTQPVSNATKMILMKARSISPTGKVVEISGDKVKKIKNEEGYQEYLLAIEGVERGGEVELISVEKKPLTMFGSENVQFQLPIMREDLSLIMPLRLKFDTKGYNGFPKAKDSMRGEVHFYTASQDNIPALEEEEYSNYKAYARHFDYKLSYLDDNPDVRQLTWSDLVKQLYTKYYSFTNKERRLTKEYLESIGVKEEDDEVKKIQKIEDHMKNEIAMSESLKEDNDNEDFGKILDKKLTTEEGYIRLFCACLTEAGVRHELGISSSRYAHAMDDSLELWNMLDVYVIYFPKQQQYLSPSAINYRYPFIPVGLGNSKGLFCKPTSLGGMVSALPDIRTIPALPIGKSTNSIDANVTFSPGDMTPLIDVTHGYTGYAALGVRELFLYSPKDKEQENVKSIITLAEKTEDIKNYSVKGVAYKNYYSEKPLEVNLSLRSPQLMEKAGPKYLFKVGDIIGRQAELYSEQHRVLPIDVQYSHSFVRNINITIPQGYKIVNPEAVKFNIIQNVGGKQASGFTSDYTVEGNIMKIHIREFYDQLSFPVSEYEPFRKVINAAADFNKVVLVLQKTDS